MKRPHLTKYSLAEFVRWRRRFTIRMTRSRVWEPRWLTVSAGSMVWRWARDTCRSATCPPVSRNLDSGQETPATVSRRLPWGDQSPAATVLKTSLPVHVLTCLVCTRVWTEEQATPATETSNPSSTPAPAPSTPTPATPCPPPPPPPPKSPRHVEDTCPADQCQLWLCTRSGAAPATSETWVQDPGHCPHLWEDQTPVVH